MEEAVESILYGDYMIADRDAPDRFDPNTGGIKHYPLEGRAWMSVEVRKQWYACTVSAFIKSYRIVGTNSAFVEGIPERRIDPNRIFVTVQMEVLGLSLWEEGHRSLPMQRCGWQGLKIHDKQTGKDEYFFDQLDDEEAFIAQVKSFGTPVGTVNYTLPRTDQYLRVPKHRRQWEFGIAMYRDMQGIWRPESPYFPPHTSLREAIKASNKLIQKNQKLVKECVRRNYEADSLCARMMNKPDYAREWIKPLLELNKVQ